MRSLSCLGALLLAGAASCAISPQLEEAASLANWCDSFFGGNAPGECEKNWTGAFFVFGGDIHDGASQVVSYASHKKPGLRYGDGHNGWPTTLVDQHGNAVTENFSARFTRTVFLPGGVFRFTAHSDDGIRVVVRPIKTINDDGSDPYNSDMATSSAELLANAGPTPPRPGDGGSVIDGEVIFDGEWRERSAAESIDPVDRYYPAGSYLVAVEYYQRYGGATVDLDIELLSATGCSSSDWVVEYFPNKQWSGPAVSTECLSGEDIHRRWVGNGGSLPPGGIGPDGFTARMTRRFESGGIYDVNFSVDDGAHLMVNGEEKHAMLHPVTGSVAQDVMIPPGATVTVNYRQEWGGAFLDADFVMVQGLCGPSDWTVEYYDNADWQGQVVARECLGGEDIHRRWVGGGDVIAPPAGLGPNYFSARLVRRFDSGGTYDIDFLVDDRAYLEVNGSTEHSVYQPTTGGPSTAEGVTIPAGAAVAVYYRQDTAGAYLDVDFRTALHAGPADIIVECPIPWQKRSATYYRIYRHSANGQREGVFNYSRGDYLWPSDSNQRLKIDVDVEAPYSASGQLFDVELWINDQLDSTYQVTVPVGQSVSLTETCNRFPQSNLCPSTGQQFDFNYFCQIRHTIDNCCHVPSCILPETTPGGVCDPAGDGMQEVSDISQGGWEAGFYCYQDWVDLKC